MRSTRFGNKFVANANKARGTRASGRPQRASWLHAQSGESPQQPQTIWVERSKSFRVANISKRTKLTRFMDSARGWMDKTMAKEIRCDCETVNVRDALTLLVEFIEPADGTTFVPKRDMAHLKILVQHAKKALPKKCHTFDLPEGFLGQRCGQCDSLFPNGNFKFCSECGARLCYAMED